MNKLNNITNVTNHCTLASSSSFHLCGANLIPLCSFVLCVLKCGPHENIWLQTKHSYGFFFKCSKYLCSQRLVLFEYDLLHSLQLKILEGPLLPQTQILCSSKLCFLVKVFSQPFHGIFPSKFLVPF